jgi:hypothetical protein
VKRRIIYNKLTKKYRIQTWRWWAFGYVTETYLEEHGVFNCSLEFDTIEAAREWIKNPKCMDRPQFEVVKGN